MYPWLILVDVRQKPTQYCKAIIFQLKINKDGHTEGQHKLSPLQGFLTIKRFLAGNFQFVPALHRDNVCINLSNAIKALNLIS